MCSLISIRIGITSSAIGLKVCSITAGIKNEKSIIKKKKKKHDKILLLAKTKINNIEVLISKGLIESNIGLVDIKKVLVDIKSKLIDTDGVMYLTVESLIGICNIITGSTNITLKKINVKPYGFGKRVNIRYALSNNRPIQWKKFTSTKFYSIISNKIHPFYDGNGRTCKIVLANDGVLRQII